MNKIQTTLLVAASISGYASAPPLPEMTQKDYNLYTMYLSALKACYRKNVKAYEKLWDRLSKYLKPDPVTNCYTVEGWTRCTTN